MAPIPTYLIYSLSEGMLLPLQFYFILLAAALMSAAIFWFSFRSISRKSLAFVLGVVLSYVALIVSVLASGGAEATMWLPIIVFLGVPAMAPLVILSAILAASCIPSSYHDSGTGL